MRRKRILENMIRSTYLMLSCGFNLCHCSNYHVCENKRALREVQTKIGVWLGGAVHITVLGTKLLNFHLKSHENLCCLFGKNTKHRVETAILSVFVVGEWCCNFFSEKFLKPFLNALDPLTLLFETCLFSPTRNESTLRFAHLHK